MQITLPPRRPLAPLPERVQAEMQVLRAAAAILDLQDTIAEPIRTLPSVQALIQAAASVFDELGFAEAEGLSDRPA